MVGSVWLSGKLRQQRMGRRQEGRTRGRRHQQGLGQVTTERERKEELEAGE